MLNTVCSTSKCTDGGLPHRSSAWLLQGGDPSEAKKASKPLKTRAVSRPVSPVLKAFQIALPALVVLLALLYIQFAS